MSIQHDGISAEQRRHLTAPTRRGARGDPAVRCTCSTTSVSSPTGQSIVVLQVAGEVDLATVDFLATALTAVLRRQPDHLIVDLAQLSFCGACGLTVLAEAGVTAAGNGTRYSVSTASRLMTHCWSRLWARDEQPTQLPTCAAAVGAAWGRPAPSTPQYIVAPRSPLDNVADADTTDHLATTALVAAPAA
jgi:anti-anti-sigma factor